MDLLDHLVQLGLRLKHDDTKQVVNIANEMSGLKADLELVKNQMQVPSLDWQANNLVQAFKVFKRYCQLILKTPA